MYCLYVSQQHSFDHHRQRLCFTAMVVLTKYDRHHSAAHLTTPGNCNFLYEVNHTMLQQRGIMPIFATNTPGMHWDEGKTSNLVSGYNLCLQSKCSTYLPLRTWSWRYSYSEPVPFQYAFRAAAILFVASNSLRAHPPLGKLLSQTLTLLCLQCVCLHLAFGAYSTSLDTHISVSLFSTFRIGSNESTLLPLFRSLSSFLYQRQIFLQKIGSQ